MPIATPSASVTFFLNPRLVPQERFEQFRASTLSQLRQAGLDVEGDWTITDDASATNTRYILAKQEPDLLVLAFPSWVDEGLPLVVLRDYSGACALWSDYEGLAFAGLSGIVSTNSNLLRMQQPVPALIGPLDQPAIQREFRALAAAAKVRRSLPNVRVGTVGSGCPGMLGVEFGEVALAKLGPQLVRLKLTDLLARAERVPARSATAIAREAARGGRVVEPSEEDFERSARLYLAFRSLVDEYAFHVIGVRCWPELRFQHGFTPCLAFARLMDEGIMGVCENDPAAGVTMLVGHWFSGEPVFLGDISQIDPGQNTLRLWHCGAAALGLACTTCEVELRHSRSAALGVQVEFPLRPGRVTLAKLSRPLNGRAQLFVTSGEAIETTPIRGNVVEIRLDLPVDRVVQRILDRGVEHHLVVVYGDYAPHFARLSQLLDVDFVVPA